MMCGILSSCDRNDFTLSLVMGGVGRSGFVYFESFWYEHIKNGCNEYACLIQDWPRIIEGGYKREK